MNDIGQQLDPLGLEIRSQADETTGEKIWAMVRVVLVIIAFMSPADLSLAPCRLIPKGI
jgi:hypothetical protein